MEVVIPATPMSTMPTGFEFNIKTSPFLSAPSSPKRFGPPELYLSAPASPTRASELYRDFVSDLDAAFSFQTESAPTGGVPFNWEETPGTPKLSKTAADDFAFAVDSEQPSLSAEELFHGGKIRPLKPPPRLLHQIGETKTNGGGEICNRKSQGKKIIEEAFSAPHDPDRDSDFDFDPFAPRKMQNSPADREREREGRARSVWSSSSSRSRRETRSLSPHRASEGPNLESAAAAAADNSSSSKISSSRSRKWRLRDFLLFRSASEGRATDKDGQLKYRSLFKKNNNGDDDDKGDRSFGSGEGSRRRGGGQVSAHERHYTANRAVAVDRRKKTFLPYKQGIFSFGTAFTTARRS